MDKHLVSIRKTYVMYIHKTNFCVYKTSLHMIFLFLCSNFTHPAFLPLSPVPFTITSVMTNSSCTQANNFSKSKLDVVIQTIKIFWIDKELLFNSTHIQSSSFIIYLLSIDPIHSHKDKTGCGFGQKHSDILQIFFE